MTQADIDYVDTPSSGPSSVSMMGVLPASLPYLHGKTIAFAAWLGDKAVYFLGSTTGAQDQLTNRYLSDWYYLLYDYFIQ